MSNRLNFLVKNIILFSLQLILSINIYASKKDDGISKAIPEISVSTENYSEINIEKIKIKEDRNTVIYQLKASELNNVYLHLDLEKESATIEIGGEKIATELNFNYNISIDEAINEIKVLTNKNNNVVFFFPLITEEFLTFELLKYNPFEKTVYESSFYFETHEDVVDLYLNSKANLSEKDNRYCLTIGKYKFKGDFQIQKNIVSQKQLKENLNIDFLDEKYQIQGYQIPDYPNPYPTYSYLGEKTGGFAVSYIGKTDQLQYFWNVNNQSGFFSKYSDAEETGYKSDDIKKLINIKDYYIVASYLPGKYISYLGDEDFDLKPNAKTTFFLYENNKWKFIGEIETDKLPENLLAYKISLIQKDIYNNLVNSTDNYNGSYSVSIETESTTIGTASISYQFNIDNNNVNLSIITFHEPILCEGRYFAKEESNLLEIYYFDDQLSCVSIEPKIYIKKEGKKMYIKGLGGEATFNKWILLESQPQTR